MKSVRPKEVSFAYLLLLGSLVLGLFKAALIPIPGSIRTGIVVLAVLWALSMAIGNGKRWARNAFAVLFLLGLPGLLFVREALANQGLLFVTILIVQTILQVAAMVLLFLPASRLWFSKTAHEPDDTLS